VNTPAVSLSVLYQGEETVDLRVYNDIGYEYKRFTLSRDGTGVDIPQWESMTTDQNVYFSDTVPSFSSHTYVLDSYKGTNGIDWIYNGTDTATADTSIMSGTLHNSLDWQILLGRSPIDWDNQTEGYTVSSVNVADGDLGIYNTTVRLNDSAHCLKATGPGTIMTGTVTFSSTTSAGGTVTFEDQSDPAVEPINGCTFQSVDLTIKNSTGVEIKNTSFNDSQLTSDSGSSGTIFNNCSGSYDLTIGGDGVTVRDCTGILELYITGTNHSILRNNVRNMEARGDSCTIQDNTFTNIVYNWIRLDLYGNSNHVLENTLDHRVADSGYPMIRILGESNIVEKNTITEYVAGAGAWGEGINIQNGINNTVQLNRIIGYISGASTNNHGITLDNATGNLIKKNTIKNCQNGIWLGFPRAAGSNNIENNAISSTIRAAIDIGDGCNTNVIAYNHIWDASAGLYISGDGNGIHENIISGCTYRGIQLLNGASNTWVYNNVFRDNGSQAVDNGSGNTWNKPKTAVNRNIVGGPYLGGNYWDTYTGHDTDDDKLGDTPYSINGTAGASDGLPLIYVSMPSPTPEPTPSGLGAVVSGDYNGDGAADLAIFRGSSGLWAIRGITRGYFGSSSDLPVSGDYNGDGSADIALFRETSGLWAVRGITRVYFGSVSDQPTAGDYDGDGTCDIGIFRASSGLWAARAITRAYFGAASDLPVAGDYNGDGSADIALFRGSSGLWAVRGVSRSYFGAASDLPIPGDYNGSGARRPAIFRESSRLWAVQGVTRLYFGTAGDQPVPADFNGTGGDDLGVFRATSGLWAIRGITRSYFGITGDLPVTR